MLVAAIIDSRYGVPQVDKSRNVIEAAKKLKRDLFTGAQTNLAVEKQKKKERYPAAIHDLAEKSWLTKATIPEPAKHERPLLAPTDGVETIPNLLSEHSPVVLDLHKNLLKK